VRVVDDGTIALKYQRGEVLPSELANSTTGDGEASQILVNADDSSLGYTTGRGAPPASSGTATYVIITTSDIQSGSAELASFVQLKQAEGYTVAVETESAWGGGTGDAAAENIRRWLKNNYVSLGIQYVLLIGDPDPEWGDVPMKMTWPRPTATDGDTQSPTDYYYADLTSNWDANGDGQYGEWGSNGDFTQKPLPEVCVGRHPGLRRGLHHARQHPVQDDQLPGSDGHRLAEQRAPAHGDFQLTTMKVVQESLATDGQTLADSIQTDLLAPHGFSSYKLFEQAGIDPVTAPCDAAIE